MCVIICNPKGLVIQDDVLLKASTLNPHGLGFTMLDTGVTRYVGSNDYDVLRTNRPYIAHFRYATIGKVSKRNAHPFTITASKALYQNGTVANLGGGDTTDTEAMATLLSKCPESEWKDILEMTDCRWVIVDTKKKDYTLYNESAFIERNGVLYSKANVLDGELVAVYGTLKQGFGNHSVMGYQSKFVSAGETVNTYPMIDQGVPFVSGSQRESRSLLDYEITVDDSD